MYILLGLTIITCYVIISSLLLGYLCWRWRFRCTGRRTGSRWR
ncbi:Protein of unknown function [Gryllus bimaculatus]|nr:Protein of unknown function [Gryllus bimaculatus]